MERQNSFETKELLVSNFKQYEFDNMPNNFGDIISNLISRSEEMYVYRTLEHHFVEDGFMQWLKNENEIIFYNEILLNFSHHNILDKYISKNNENIYNLLLNKTNKKKIVNEFNMFIEDSIEFNRKKRTSNLTHDDLYFRDRLSDQYDFIFTTESNVLFWTDIHCFQFFISDEYLYE